VVGDAAHGKDFTFHIMDVAKRKGFDSRMG